MISSEEGIVYSQAIHYANRMVYMMIPLYVSDKLPKPGNHPTTSGGMMSYAAFKEVLSVLMLCAPVFIFTSGSSALLGHPRCGYRSDCRYLPYSIHFSEFMVGGWTVRWVDSTVGGWTVRWGVDSTVVDSTVDGWTVRWVGG